MAFCRYCGADEADAKFCARCGMATAPLSGGASSTPAGAEAPPAADFVTGDNTAGALAYLLLPAVYFLFLTDTYKQNRFVRFHSYQALFYCGGMFALIWVVWNVLWFILLRVPRVCGGLAYDDGIFCVLGKASDPSLPRPDVQNPRDRRSGRETVVAPTWRTSPDVPCRHSWRHVFTDISLPAYLDPMPQGQPVRQRQENEKSDIFGHFA